MKSEIRQHVSTVLVATIAALSVSVASNAASPQVAAIPAAEVVCIDGVPICRAPVEPTVTSAPTASPTPSPVLPTVQATGPNLLRNAGFEAPFPDTQYGTYNHQVAYGWWPFFCSSGYMSLRDSDCPALRRDSRSPARPGFNDPWLLFGRPEYKPSGCCAGRYRSGRDAQQMFSFQRVHNGGVCQTTSTIAGAVYEAGAYVQTWSANGNTGTDGVPFTSDIRTTDDRANSVWFIRAVAGGSVDNRQIDVFAPGALVSRAFDFADGHYDHFAPIRFTFQATADLTTVCFQNVRLYPVVHNDAYTDDAWLRRVP
jgi:hypothetical protein